ncbi:polyprenyl synthetase family protein [Maritimibacter fusiformis]|uniref:Geranylgeranyl diphosphate synthase n=1 Tax=Maritimibacter fusiformis TaxID=2603819 RepID=A0A5D0RAB7_9RHOB|nr:farnesyl diphosphate synthase [Maritimibacter fusiformis]TYB77806.1 polyprenyl synthetase family protein [Maritimibacter fusiformis]
MFRSRLAETREVAQACLGTALPASGPMAAPMRHAVAGGKGMRAFLVLEGARMLGIDADSAQFPAAAVEAIHAYSLVHDDLPCMDDDDLRRGQPTVHRKWDEATAVLAGDALQALAFELLGRDEVGTAEVRIELSRSLAHAAGAEGMVLGQALDIAAETAETPLTLDQIIALQAGKTGALIRWSAMAGAVMAGVSTDPLRRYGAAVGLAFQIADDVLDVEGDPDRVGKATGKDADKHKATFVSLLGLDAAKTRAQELVDAACEALAPYGNEAQTLREAARFVISRDS